MYIINALGKNKKKALSHSLSDLFTSFPLLVVVLLVTYRVLGLPSVSAWVLGTSLPGCLLFSGCIVNATSNKIKHWTPFSYSWLTSFCTLLLGIPSCICHLCLTGGTLCQDKFCTALVLTQAVFKMFVTWAQLMLCWAVSEPCRSIDSY